MKTGKAYIQTVAVECPYCGSSETVSKPGGVMTIDWNMAVDTVECLDCGKECKMPKTAK